MDSTKVFVKRKENCAFQVIDDEALIVKVAKDKGSKVYSLNTTGTVIWNLADGKTSMEDICRHVRDSFELGPDTDIDLDVDTYIRDMVERELIEVIDDEPENR